MQVAMKPDTLRAMIAWIVLICVLVAAFAALMLRRTVRRVRRAAAQAPDADQSGVAEASINLDVADVRPFLEVLTASIPALGALNVEPIVAAVSALPVEGEQSWSVESAYGGRPTHVEVRAVMDDVGAVDFYFFTVPQLAAMIGQEMRDFVRGRGLP